MVARRIIGATDGSKGEGVVTIDASAGSWLAAQMRLWRERALLTQEQLAQCTGLGVRTIRRLESHVDRRPRSGSIRLLAAALNLSGEELAQLVSASNGKPVQSQGLVPRQLPRDVAGFTGRAAQLAFLDGRRPGSVVVISGTAGVGKTSLAVHWAHRTATKFADGQLYVNLRGFGPSATPVEPATVIRGFLAALGVPRRRIPPEAHAQAALYRSLMADRRMLLVLDNAGDAEQVRPLLPAGRASLVVVTSRYALAGLVATDGAELVGLDLMGAGEARRLLTRRIGQRRARSDPGAVDEIVACCAGLPIALAVTAATAAAEPALSLAVLADRLRDSGRRLDELDVADDATSLRGVFSWSYRRLEPEAARLFRALGRHRGTEITLDVAACLAALPTAQTAALLADLVSAHLICEPRPGCFVLHDLLRLFARELARDGNRPL